MLTAGAVRRLGADVERYATALVSAADPSLNAPRRRSIIPPTAPRHVAHGPEEVPLVLGSGKEMQDRLSKLVAIFEGLDFRANRAGGDDLLCDAYEYLMRHFATESGDTPVVAGLHTILCRGNDDAWAPGFQAYLQFIPAFRSALARLAAGTSVYAISATQLAAVELRLPPRSEQAAIVGVLSDMDAEIATLERRLDKMRAVKQGIMQQLLTGRVQLVKPAAPAAP